MPEPSPPVSSQRQAESWIKVYMPEAMRAELERRAETSPGEGSSLSKIVRSAIREYFRRHPAP